MKSSMLATLLALHLIHSTLAHVALFHPSMYGFNVTDKTFPYDNRPVAPVKDMTFDQWWFHGHLDYPPNEGDIFNLPAGQAATAELACHRGATSYHQGVDGGDIRDPEKPNDPCPGSPTDAYHTTGFDDLKGCALAIAYKDDASQVVPEDFVIFSVNQTCVWNRFTDFQVPERMPACPDGGCTCAWFWTHSINSGGQENYMNGFKCNVTGSTFSVPLAEPRVARRCGQDPENDQFEDFPGSCTYGAKAPFYWFNKERNNMFEGYYSPPHYNDLYNFRDGPQDDIFTDSYLSLPDPSPDAPLPVLAPLGKDVNETVSTPSAPRPTAGGEAPPTKRRKCVRTKSITNAYVSLKRANGDEPLSAKTVEDFIKIQSLFREELTFN